MVDNIYHSTQNKCGTTPIGKLFPSTRKPQHELQIYLDILLHRHGPTTKSFPCPRLTNRFKTKVQRECWSQYLTIDPWYTRKMKYHPDTHEVIASTANHYCWTEQALPELHERYGQMVPNIPDSKILPWKEDIFFSTRVQIEDWQNKFIRLKEAGLYGDIYKLDNMPRQNGKLLTGYHRQSGRYWSDIQWLLSSDAREILFEEYYNNDIESCLPTIFQHFEPKSLVADYIVRKDYFRLDLAEALDIDYGLAKAIINALFFGVRHNEKQLYWLAHDAIDKKSWLMENLTFAQVEQLLQIEWFINLANQVQQMKKQIVSDHYSNQKVRLDGTYRITNPHNDTIELKRWDANRIAAHHYFGVESQIQDLAMRFVGDLDNTIWLHDGFMTNHEIDTQKLELLIKKELKVKVRYKQTKKNQLVLATG